MTAKKTEVKVTVKGKNRSKIHSKAYSAWECEREVASRTQEARRCYNNTPHVLYAGPSTFGKKYW